MATSALPRPDLPANFERLTVGDLVSVSAQRFPEEQFFRFEDDVLTFGLADSSANRVANGLRALGVRKGDRVAVFSRNRPEVVIAWLALAKLGAVEVPINAAYFGDALLSSLRDSQVCGVIAEADLIPALESVSYGSYELKCVVAIPSASEELVPVVRLGLDLVAWTDFASESPQPPDIAVHTSDPATISYTSGTTGVAKGSILPHRRIVLSAADTARVREVQRSDVLYNPFPFFHGNAKNLTAACALIAGATFAMGRRFSASRFMDEVRHHRATQFNYLDSILTILLKQPPSEGDRDHDLRIGMGVGASAKALLEFEKRFGVVLLESYGMSEFGLCTMNRPWDRRTGSCGRALDGFEVAVVDEYDEPVAPDLVGEIVVRPRRSFGMHLGYLNRPDETVLAWRNLWMHTGDLGRLDSDGYLYFVGRRKEAIRRKGENIPVRQIEAVIDGHPAVSESAVVAADVADGEEVELQLVVVPHPNAYVTPGELAAFCLAELPAFWVPRYFRVQTQALPRTPTGKLQRFLIAEGTSDPAWDRMSDRHG